MRNTLFILTLILLFTGCKKNTESNKTEGGKAALTGTWELYKTKSGMSTLTIHPAGNGKELIFDNTTFKMVYKGSVMDEGPYELINGAYTDVNTCAQVPAKDTNPNQILFKNSLHLKSYFEVSPTTLRITSGCIPADGGVQEYRRKSTRTTYN